MSGSNDGDGSIPVPFHDGRGLPGSCILLPVLYDVTDAFLYPIVDLSKMGRSRLAGDIGGGGNDGLAKSFDQVATKRVVCQTDGYGAVRAGEVFRQAYGTFIDNRRRFLHGVEEVKHPQVGLAGIFQHVPLIGHQYDEAFCLRPLFEGKYFFNGFGIGGVASYTPDGVGRI